MIDLESAYYYSYLQKALAKQGELETFEKERVASNKKAWYSYDSRVSRYEQVFDGVLDRRSFCDIFEAQQSEKGQVYAMDVMGTGNFDEIFPVNGEFNITLLDHRSDWGKEHDALYKGVYPGNVLLPEPWIAAREFIDRRDTSQNKGFDIITCRPIAGWNGVIIDNETSTANGRVLEWQLVNRMVGLLSRGGNLFVAMPETTGKYTTWSDDINATDGLSAKSDYHYVRIVKDKSTPGKLPPIPYPRQVIFQK